MKKQITSVLSIAGSDSSGGAGIQADIKTISALGCYAASVVTAVTAQNTCEVSRVHPIPAHIVGEQIERVLEDIPFSAIKIGMLSHPEIINVVAEKIIQWRPKNIVLDPVMISKSGHSLISPDACHILKNKLFSLVDLITPNLNEAAALLDYVIDSPQAMEEAALELAHAFQTNVLIKGGHLPGNSCNDLLMDFQNNTLHWYETIRIDTKNTHGTGCTFSSAIATFLAQGNALTIAVKKAKDYLTNAILQGSHAVLGKGHGPVSHFD